MNSILLFDFSIDKESKTIYIKREFDAEIALVWKAWTTANLLDQWCAPNPYRTETKTLDFREGGFWHYALVSPEGNKHWNRYDYREIEFQKTIIEWRSVCDEDGVVGGDTIPTECILTFTEIPTTNGSKTLITINEKYGGSEMFEKMATDNHKIGFRSHLKNLDRFLQTQKNK